MYSLESANGIAYNRLNLNELVSLNKSLQGLNISNIFGAEKELRTSLPAQ